MERASDQRAQQELVPHHHLAESFLEHINVFRCFLCCCSPISHIPSLRCTFTLCCSWGGLQLQRSLNLGAVPLTAGAALRQSSDTSGPGEMRTWTRDMLRAALGGQKCLCLDFWGYKQWLSPGLDSVCPNSGQPWAQKCPHLDFLAT